MKRIHIFRHVPHEGPGYFGEFLDGAGVPYELIAIDQDQAIPSTLENVAGLVFMGGPMSVNDPLPWIDDELRLIRQAFNAKLPILGHCLGGQLISKALGGHVGPNPVKEIGWFPVETTVSAAQDDWLSGLPARFEVFHWHGETFSIPTGATPILHNEHCAHQGFVIDNTLALQCHVEMTNSMVHDWAQANDTEIAYPSATVQNMEQMTDRLEQRVQQLNAYAAVLYARWLRPILAAQQSG